MKVTWIPIKLSKDNITDIFENNAFRKKYLERKKKGGERISFS